jgi:hypothetical protein
MKKILLAALVAAFACVSAVQAGETCQSACGAKAKSACETKAALAKARAQAAEKGATLLAKR